MTRREKFKFYHQNFLNQPLTEGGLLQLCQAFSALVVERVIDSPEIPGAENFLKIMYKKAKCFVVSATPDEEIDIIVKSRGIEKYFYDILGSSRSKTENITYLMGKHKLNPNKCIFYGDAESDYRAAQNCHISFIGILPGYDAPLLKIVPDIRWRKDFTRLSKENSDED